jgi:hypothetical protein
MEKPHTEKVGVGGSIPSLGHHQRYTVAAEQVGHTENFRERHAVESKILVQ